MCETSRFIRQALCALIATAALVLALVSATDAKVMFTVSMRYSVLRTAMFTLDDLENLPDFWTLTITTDTTITSAYIHEELSSDGYGWISKGNTEMFEIKGTVVKRNTDFKSLYGEMRNSDFEDRVREIMRFPEDRYYFKFQLWDGGDNPMANRGLEPAGKLLTEQILTVGIVNPTPPVLINPAEGAFTSVFPTLQWQPCRVRGLIGGEPPLEIRYTLRLYEMFDAQGRPLTRREAINYDPIWVFVVVNGSSVVFSPGEAARALIPGMTYVWQVEAVDEVGRPVGGNEGKSDILSFTAQFMSPRLLNPVGGMELTVLPPVFSWVEAVAPGAELSYDLALDTSPGYVNPFERRGILGNSYAYPQDALPFAPGTAYYWKIQTVDSMGRLLGRPVEEDFMTPGLRLVRPLDQIVSTLTPNFAWHPYWNIQSYEITVLDLQRNLIWTSTVFANSVTYGGPVLNYDTTYLWNLQALQDGMPLGVTAEATFTTPSAALIVPSLISPVGITVDTRTPTFQWNPVEGATEYSIRVSDARGEMIHTGRSTLTTYTYPAEAQLLEYDAAYSWVVQAFAQGSPLGVPSEPAVFHTLTEPEAPERLPYAATGISFIWDRIPGAVEYTFAISENSDLSRPLWVTRTSRTIVFYPDGAPGFVEGRTYYYGGEGLDAYGNPVGTFSGTFTPIGPPGEHVTSMEELSAALKALLVDHPQFRELEGLSLSGIWIGGNQVAPDEVLELVRSFRIIEIRMEP